MEIGPGANGERISKVVFTSCHENTCQNRDVKTYNKYNEKVTMLKFAEVMTTNEIIFIKRLMADNN
jgi:hypothetical protein